MTASAVTQVSCEGDTPTSRHPRIYLDLEKTGRAVCPYCSKVFTPQTAV